MMQSRAHGGAVELDITRVLGFGPLVLLASITCVHLARLLVIRIPGVDARSAPLGIAAPTIDTWILVTVAIFVYVAVATSADRPARRFRRVAFVALLVSFLPLLIAVKAGKGPTAAALAIMHIAAYVPTVTLLPWLTLVRADDVAEPRPTD